MRIGGLLLHSAQNSNLFSAHEGSAAVRANIQFDVKYCVLFCSTLDVVFVWLVG